MLFTGVNCGDLTGKQYSQYLEGALSTNQEFFFIDMVVNDVVGPDYRHEGKLNHKNITEFIDDSITVDKDNDVLVTSDGKAIIDAYNFRGLNDTEFDMISEAIVKRHEMDHPEYEFVLLPGEFPLGVDGKLVVNGKLKKEETTYNSSHILYVKDYKKHLVPAKQKQKK